MRIDVGGINELVEVAGRVFPECVFCGGGLISPSFGSFVYLVLTSWKGLNGAAEKKGDRSGQGSLRQDKEDKGVGSRGSNKGDIMMERFGRMEEWREYKESTHLPCNIPNDSLFASSAQRKEHGGRTLRLMTMRLAAGVTIVNYPANENQKARQNRPTSSQ